MVVIRGGLWQAGNAHGCQREGGVAKGGGQSAECRGLGCGLGRRESCRRLVVMDDICEAIEDETEEEGVR